MWKFLLPVQFALLCAALLAAHALPVDVNGVDVANAELEEAAAFATRDDSTPHVVSRRKVGNVSGSTPREYMEELLSRYTTVDRKPTHGPQDPTDVWCFLDKDIVAETQRPKMHSDLRCVTYTSYTFSWKALLEDSEEVKKGIPVQKAILRAYLQAISRHFEGNESIVVNISAFVEYHASNRSRISSDFFGVSAGEQQVEVNKDTNDAVEVDITEGLHSMWPPTLEETDITVTLRLAVPCTLNLDGKLRRVPATLANPAEIPTHQVARRERNMNVQPLLVVFFSDEEVKMELKMEVEEEQRSTLPSSDGSIEITEWDAGNASRQARSTSAEPCRLYDFTIEFRKIELFNVIAPQMVNIRKCVGSCTHTDIKQNRVQSNNYAKIMSSATISNLTNPLNWVHNTPVMPSCTPTRFSSIYILLQTREGFRLDLYVGFIAEECGCQ